AGRDSSLLCSSVVTLSLAHRRLALLTGFFSSRSAREHLVHGPRGALRRGAEAQHRLLLRDVVGAERGRRGAQDRLGVLKSLAPLRKTSVAVAHTIGHVAATVSMSKVAASFTHIIKSGEPAFSVPVLRFSVSVYLSLVPIIGGVLGAMISNLAFVFRNIFSKREINGKSVSGMNYYACLSMLSLLILTPFVIAVEGPQMWAADWQKAISRISPHFTFQNDEIVANAVGLCDSYPISIGNTMKRISVIVSSIIIFLTPVQPINALGAAISILGTFLYSQAKQRLLHLYQFRS
ncbi:unnamed protein product, partial [Musa hybrid cultivar]